MPQLPTSAGWTAKEELHAVLDTLQSLSADHADSPLVGGGWLPQSNPSGPSMSKLCLVTKGIATNGARTLY